MTRTRHSLPLSLSAPRCCKGWRTLGQLRADAGAIGSGPHVGRCRHPQLLAANDLEHAKALYDAEIRAVDEWVGTLVAELKRWGSTSARPWSSSRPRSRLQEHGTVLHDVLYTR